MKFLKDTLNFHIAVAHRIFNNIGFLLIVLSVYLIGDIFYWYQSESGAALKTYSNPDNMLALNGASATNWIIYLFIWIYYLSTASLFSLYYNKKNTSSIGGHVRNYFKPFINFRMYMVYSLLVVAIPLSLTLGLRFIPEVFNNINAVIVEYAKITSKSPAADINTALESSSILKDYANGISSIHWYEWIGAGSTTLVVLFGAFMMYVFALPLVIKSKDNGFFYSVKLSFKSVYNKFGLFLTTICLFSVVRLVVLLMTVNIPYVSKIASVLMSALFFFYVLEGVKQFILEKEKK